MLVRRSGVQSVFQFIPKVFSGVESVFQFIPKVFSGVEVRALCRTLEFFHSNLHTPCLHGARFVHRGIVMLEQPIPGAGLKQKHLGFEWGPGDLLVYETNFKLQGPGSGGSGCPFVHMVRRDEDIYSPILRKLFNESHHIFVGLQDIKDDVPSKNKKPQFVSISKNYRSVIRACMEELQQVAVSTKDTQYSNQVSILLAIELIWNLCEVLFIDAAPAGSLLLHLLDWVRLHKADVDEKAREVLQSESPTRHHAYWDVVMSFVLQGRMDEARQVLQKQASLQPASRTAYQLLDNLLHKMPVFNGHLEGRAWCGRTSCTTRTTALDYSIKVIKVIVFNIYNLFVPRVLQKSGDRREKNIITDTGKQQRRRSDSPEPSCVSMKSDESMEPPLNFRNGNSSSVHRVLQKSGDRREKNIITATGHDPESAAVNEFQKKFKLNLMKKFQCLNGVIINQENRTLLNEIYTELYITEGDSGDVNKEHELRQIEAASRRTVTEETPIKCNDIFKPLSEQDEPIRTVVTKGVAGIGKTVSVQKFILDWAEGKTNQDVHLIFPLPFRELNLMKEKLSLMDLLHICFNETNETEMFSVKKVLFIFDGLDECRFPLDFQNTVSVCDVNESASVHVLLINLIKGNLLPSALIWITSRPAAADQIPSEYVHRVTEVRGFNDPQKEEYFRKRISDQSLASNIITHLKSLRSLYIMCHIPVFCWISATVLERVLGEAESGEIPKTLTQMYTHFLIIQTNIIREKYSKKQESDEEMLLKLGQLAFQQLQKGNLIFYEEDLREVGRCPSHSGRCYSHFLQHST
ncbi:hypothetical protein PDJAM_G00176530 [Pangasius djambal]|uniref:Uncharacterized protein n=1 Tax=Pangasius djambal TaxID=1691987 RepID=A0ACC5ZPL6_9TELE|nr:hypothetical protein [Pangasius djambal]